MTEYEKIEKLLNVGINRKSIGNKIVGSSKCVGYCKFADHKGFLTEKDRIEHNCINKGCHYYVPKQKTKSTANLVIAIPDYSNQIFEMARRLLITEEAFLILKVKQNDLLNYTVKYISITNEPLKQDYKQQLENYFGFDIEFEKLKYDFDVCYNLLMSREV